MRRRLPVLAACLALVAPSGAALAQTPFSPLPPAQQPTATQAPTQPNNASTTDNGLANWQKIMIFAAGAILLAGIGWAIVLDARKRAPVKERVAEPGIDPHRERAKQRERKKQKQARAQRRRNR